MGLTGVKALHLAEELTAAVAGSRPDGSLQWVGRLTALAREMTARRGGERTRAVLTLKLPDGRSMLADVGALSAAIVPPGLPSLTGQGPELSITVSVRDAAPPGILIEAFLEGLAHGFEPGSASRIEIAGRTRAIERHVLGLDVTCLFAEPVTSLAEDGRNRPGHLKSLFLGSDHAALGRFVRLAELRGEAIVSRFGSLDGAFLVREQGECCYSLMTASCADDALEALKRADTPVLLLSRHVRGIICTRWIGHAIDGPCADRPGRLLSFRENSGEALKRDYFRHGRRLGHPEPDMADRIVQSWASRP